MFPLKKIEATSQVDITKQIKEIESWVINRNGKIVGRKNEQIGKYRFIS
jgi:hypothetical protein